MLMIESVPHPPVTACCPANLTVRALAISDNTPASKAPHYMIMRSHTTRSRDEIDAFHGSSTHTLPYLWRGDLESQPAQKGPNATVVEDLTVRRLADGHQSTPFHF